MSGANLRYSPRMARFLTSVVVAAALLSPSGAPAQEGSFDSAGVQLHYTSRGTGAPVVLLSGGPGFNVDYVLPIAEFLPSGYIEARLRPEDVELRDYWRAAANFPGSTPLRRGIVAGGEALSYKSTATMLTSRPLIVVSGRRASSRLVSASNWSPPKTR